MMIPPALDSRTAGKARRLRDLIAAIDEDGRPVDEDGVGALLDLLPAAAALLGDLGYPIACRNADGEIR